MKSEIKIGNGSYDEQEDNNSMTSSHFPDEEYDRSCTACRSADQYRQQAGLNGAEESEREICEEKIAAVSAAQRLYPTTRNKSALKRIIHS
jgi:hypothetical protein